MEERRRRFSAEFDFFRSAIVNEPRGSDVMVGALLCEPSDHRCASGVIFFNNVGALGMSGHATIGVAVTLAHLGRIAPGRHEVETPVGAVAIELHEDQHHVTFQNVPSFRQAHDVSVDVPPYGRVQGDVAWGGNWFFLVSKHPLELELCHLPELLAFASATKRVLRSNNIMDRRGAEIDHVGLFRESTTSDSRNFVLCPGGTSDRSPCGTGTSARIACLAEDGKLRPGQVWTQESLLGTRFEASCQLDTAGGVRPSITGAAWSQ